MVKCDGKYLAFEAGFFNKDTIFNADVTGKEKGGKGQTGEVIVTGDDNIYPLIFVDGQQLPDRTTTMVQTFRSYSGSPSGRFVAGSGWSESKFTTTVSSSGIKVQGKTDITTPVGTFSCYKIVQTSTSKMKPKPPVDIPPAEGVIYFDPSVGIVRSEGYVNGQLVGYSELVKLKK
jgi:hypothetical protein